MTKQSFAVNSDFTGEPKKQLHRYHDKADTTQKAVPAKNNQYSLFQNLTFGCNIHHHIGTAGSLKLYLVEL